MEAEDDKDGTEDESTQLIFEESSCFDNTQFLDTGIIDLDSYPDEDHKCINEDVISIKLAQDSASPVTVEPTAVTKPICIKLVDCYKFPWYFDQYTKDVIERNLAVNNCVNMNVTEDTMGVTSKEGRNDTNIVECNNKVIYCDKNITLSVKTNISKQITDDSLNKCDKSENKETATNPVHKTLHAHRKRDPVKIRETVKKRNDIDLLVAINQRHTTKAKADPKKNIGYIGMKVKRIAPDKQATDVKHKMQKAKALKKQNGFNNVVSKALYNVGTIITPVCENAKTLETDKNEKDSIEGTPITIVSETVVSKECYIGTTIMPVFKKDETSETVKTETDLKSNLPEVPSTVIVNEMTKIAEEIIDRVKTTTKTEIRKNTDYKNRLCKPMPFTLKEKYYSEARKMKLMMSPVSKAYKNFNQLKNLAKDSVSTSDINIKITEDKTGNVQTHNMNNVPDFHTHETNHTVQNKPIPIINKNIANNTNVLKLQATVHKKLKPRQLQSKEIQKSNNDLEASARCKNVSAEKHNIEKITLPLNTIVMKTAKTDDAKIDGMVNSSILDVMHSNTSNSKNLVSQSEICLGQDYFARTLLTKGLPKQSLKVPSATYKNIDNYNIDNSIDKANSKPTPIVSLEKPSLVNATPNNIRSNESNNEKEENTNPEKNLTIQPHQFTISNATSVIRPTPTPNNQKQVKVSSPLRSHILYDPQAKPTSAHMNSWQDTLQFQMAPYIQPHNQYAYQHSGAPAYTHWHSNPSLAGEMAQYLTMSMPIQNIPPQMSNVPSTGYGPITPHKRSNEGPQRNKQAAQQFIWNGRLPSTYGPIPKQMRNNTAQKRSSSLMTSNHSSTRFCNGHEFWSPNYPPPSIPHPPLPSMPPPPPPPPPSEPPESQYIVKPTESEINNHFQFKKILIPYRSNIPTDRKDVRNNNVPESQPATTKCIVQNGLGTKMPRVENPIANDKLSISSKVSSGNTKRTMPTKCDSSNLKNAPEINTFTKHELQQHEPRKNILLADPLLENNEFAKRAMTFKHNKVTCTAVPNAPKVKANQPQPIKKHTVIQDPILDQASYFKAKPLQVVKVNDSKDTEVKKSSAVTYKPGPLSKRKRETKSDSVVDPNLNNKQSVFSGASYSPPVLPIPPTYEKPGAYYHFNKDDVKKESKDRNDIIKKRKYDQDSKVEVDMKRANEKRIDEAINNMKKETFKKQLDVSRRASNVDSDAGYDSDITIKL